MVAWGVCTTLLGLVHNFGGLLAARSALGIAEGGLFPGMKLSMLICSHMTYPDVQVLHIISLCGIGGTSVGSEW